MMSFKTHVLHHNKRLQIIIVTGRLLIFQLMQTTRTWMLENFTNKTLQAESESTPTVIVKKKKRCGRRAGAPVLEEKTV